MYFAILISHTSLAVAIVPMVFLTTVRAYLKLGEERALAVRNYLHDQTASRSTGSR